MSQKRYIGLLEKEEFDILKEDLSFLNDCLKTVLKDYGAYFKERYIEGKSVRRYAEAHGSVPREKVHRPFPRSAVFPVHPTAFLRSF